MTDLDLLIAMIRQTVDGPTTHRGRRAEVHAEERRRESDIRRRAQEDRDAAAVMAWACPSLMKKEMA